MNKREQITNDIVNSYKPFTNLTLLLSMRFGKTKLAINLIEKMYNVDNSAKFLWVTPNTKLRDEDIPNEFSKWNCQHLIPNVTTVCYSSLHKLNNHFDVVILDELQKLTELFATPLILKNFNHKCIIGLTGTLPKSRVKLDLLNNLGILSNVFSYKLDDAVKDSIVAPYKIYLIPVELDNINKNIKSGNKNSTFYQTEYQKYKWLNRRIEQLTSNFQTVPKSYYLQRMRFIYNLPTKIEITKRLLEKLKDKRGLIFTSNIDVSNQISENTYNSKTNKEKLNAFQNKEINHLVMVNSGSVGYTYQDCDYLIIQQIDSNNIGDSLQKLSRVLIYRPDYTALIFIVYAKNTQDEVWLKSFLEDVDKSKVREIKF